jgi:hypothetical protein
MSHRDADAIDRDDPQGWDRLVEERLMLPYLITQRLVQLLGDVKRLDDFTSVAAVDFGGDFGFSGQMHAPESGFLTGLAKSVFLEFSALRGHKTLRAKAIDAPRGKCR